MIAFFGTFSISGFRRDTKIGNRFKGDASISIESLIGTLMDVFEPILQASNESD